MPDPFKPFKPKDIQELIDLFDNDEVTTADQVDRPQKALDREMFQTAFRQEKAGGGMLVEPGFGGVRQGYADDQASKKLKSFIGKKKKIKATVLKQKVLDLGYTKYDSQKIKKKFPNLEIIDDLPISIGRKGQTNYSDKELNVANRYTNLENKKRNVKAKKYLELDEGDKKKIFNIMTRNNNKFVKDYASRKDRFNSKIEKKIMDEFPNVKFDFEKHGKYGVIQNIDGKRNPNYTAVSKFQERNFKTAVGGKGKPLTASQIKKIKENFDLPESEIEWNFRTKKNPSGYKFGIPPTKHENLVGQMKNSLKKPVKTILAANRNTSEGWMSNAMYRVLQNEIKANVKEKDLTYKPIKKGNKIVGFLDTTEAGGNKRYYALKSNAEEFGDGTAWTAHADHERVKKFLNIAKGAQEKPDKLLTKILQDKGIDTNFRLNEILSHQRYYSKLAETKPKKLIERQIVLHHTKGVGANDVTRAAATKDLQLLTGAVNSKVRGLEKIATKRNLNTDEITQLKNYGARIQNFDGKVVGGGFTGPERQYKAIRKGGIDYAKSDQFNIKTVSKFLERLGCGDKVKAAEGGRILMGNGGDLTPCAKEGRKKLGNILTKGTGQKSEQLLATQILKAGPLLRGAVSLPALLGPQAMIFYAGTEAGLVGYDMISKGKTLREAVSDSLINPLLGPKLKQDSQKLFVERLQNLGVSDQDIGKGLMFDRMTEDVQTLNNLLQRKFIADQKVEQSKQLYPAAVDKEEREAPGVGGFKFDKPLLSIPDVKDKRKKEADDIAMDIQDIYRTGDRNVLDALEFERFQKPETMKNFIEAKIQKDYLDKLVAADRLIDSQQGVRGAIKKIFQGRRGKAKDREQIGEVFNIPPDFKFAGGGIAKLAGIDEGPPPESGPMSQGLSGLLKRGNKI